MSAEPGTSTCYIIQILPRQLNIYAPHLSLPSLTVSVLQFPILSLCYLQNGMYKTSYPCVTPLTTQRFPQPQTPKLLARQVSNSSSCSCVSGGAIAGIVIGSIAGTLLIMWLIYTVRASSDTPREESSVGRSRRSRRSSRVGSHSTYVDRNGHAYRVREPSKVYYKPE
jgi:hypothetical protein